jgi:hypothetical protein
MLDAGDIAIQNSPLLPIRLSPSGAIDIFEGPVPLLSSRGQVDHIQLSAELSKLCTEWGNRKEITPDELRLFHSIQ